MSALDVQNLMDQASDAIIAGNYADAKRFALAAGAKYSAMPIMQRKEGHASGMLQWDSASISRFLSDLKKNIPAAAASAGFGIAIVKTQFNDPRNEGSVYD